MWTAKTQSSKASDSPDNRMDNWVAFMLCGFPSWVGPDLTSSIGWLTEFHFRCRMCVSMIPSILELILNNVFLPSEGMVVLTPLHFSRVIDMPLSREWVNEPTLYIFWQVTQITGVIVFREYFGIFTYIVFTDGSSAWVFKNYSFSNGWMPRATWTLVNKTCGWWIIFLASRQLIVICQWSWVGI